MKLTYIGMNNGSITEAHRLIEALRDTRDQLEDCYATCNTCGRLSRLKADERNLMASLEMVMRGDAVHATALPQDGQHSYHWHKAMRPYRAAYVAQCQSTRPAADPDDEQAEAEQHQAWLIEAGQDYAIFGGVRM
ncbi:hypothetical protein [Salmonella phage PMBT28]|nr:hypothetical protein [Salmonella phage PMBT28]